MIWTAPIVQSIGGSALAATGSPQSPGGGGGAPSYTLLVLSNGTTYLRVKIDQSGKVSCGKAASAGNGPAGTSAVRQINAQLKGTTWDKLAVNASCPAGLSASVTAAGLQVLHTGYTVVAWSVHDGAGAGCGQTSFGPGNGGSPAYVPAVGGSSSLFPKPKVTVCPI
jgi:hypothetical protein